MTELLGQRYNCKGCIASEICVIAQSVHENYQSHTLPVYIKQENRWKWAHLGSLLCREVTHVMKIPRKWRLKNTYDTKPSHIKICDAIPNIVDLLTLLKLFIGFHYTGMFLLYVAVANHYHNKIESFVIYRIVVFNYRIYSLSILLWEL